MNVYKNRFSVRVIAFVLAVMVLFLSPYAQYIDAKSNVNYVKAAEIAVGAAAEGAVEWLIALFATVGLGGAAYSNRENLASYFEYYMELQVDSQLVIADSAVDGCVKVYDSVSDVVTSIPWDDYIASLSDYKEDFDTNLTGLYMKYCPQLLMSYKDFVSSVLNGDIVIDGFSDAISDDVFVSDSDVETQLSGISYDFSASRYYSQIYRGSYPSSNIYKTSFSVSSPYSVVYYQDVVNGYTYYHVTVYYLYNGKVSVATFPTDYTSSSGSSGTSASNLSWNGNESSDITITSFAISSVVPIFSTYELAKEYLLHGTGYKNALNYDKGWSSAIENDDLPTWNRVAQQKLWEKIANAPDVGIGSYGIGASSDAGGLDWGDDIPWIGLDSLTGFVSDISDVFDNVIDSILDGTYDLTDDIPDTYTDAWQKTIGHEWNDVIDPTIPVDPTIPGEIDKPDVVDPSIPGDTDIDKPGDTDIDTPVDTPVDETVDIPSIVPDVTGDFSDLNVDLKGKFPFCLPWDIYYLLTCLADTPQTPVFVLPLYIERYSIHEDITIDMSPFETLSKISRLFFSLLYVYGLINWTVKIVSVRKQFGK